VTSVNTNIAAMNAYRNLSTTNNAMSKSLERLSSGFRINRAADDAAGLAISEGLRSQISGLTQAVRNTQDGTSVVQTAEGALSESTSILQRMRDLSVQASNSGSLNTTATSSIQKEIGQLKQELDRIANTTTFNGTKLLDGSFSSVFQVGANAGQTITVAIGSANNGMDSTGLKVANVDVTGKGTFAGGAAGANMVTTTAATAGTAATNAATLTFQATGAAGTTDWDSDTSAPAEFKKLDGTISFGGKTFDLKSVDYTGATTAANYLSKLNAAAQSALGLTSGPFAVNATKNKLDFKVAEAVTGYTAANGAPVNGASASVQDLANATATFATSSGASAAITAIDAAITAVSSARADLGAKQNRFEHTINNLNTTIENTTASESRIRDTDMASEMTHFTRTQVLTQAGTAMLAQANQSTQSILKLLG
jgi:flagellin-like hook-associated protein FlgL